MTRRPLPVMLAFWLLLPGTFTSTCSALSPAIRDAFIQELEDIHDRHPPYKKDISIRPFDPIEVGVDCSRYMFLALKKAGVGGVRRVTADDMAHGLGGWDGRPISGVAALPGDLIFWLWRESRTRGKGSMDHVGAFISSWDDGRIVIHSSSSRNGPTKSVVKGKLLEDMELVWRLTIGD